MRYFILSAIIVLFGAFAAPAVKAEIFLEAPQRVARGDAFVAKGYATEPASQLAFNWRGKKYTVQTELGNGHYVAMILLPAPLDEKSGHLRLGLEKTGANKAIETAYADITLYDKSRPTQKLTVDKKYVSPPPDQLKRIERDREKVRSVLARAENGKKWELPLLRPVPGSVSSAFGLKRVFNGQPRSVHKGLDLRGASGSPIKAVADGKVVLVDNLYYSGNTVYIDHGDGVFSAYLHMSEPKVVVGQQVKRGEIVGLVGATGRVTGPHLHLSMLVQGQSVDPLPLLEKAEVK